VKTDRYKFQPAYLFTAQWSIYIPSNLTTNYLHFSPTTNVRVA